MFCKECGTKLADSSHFCPQCGCAHCVTYPAEPVTPTAASVTPPAEPEQSFADKVRASAKKAGSSPIFLIATICFTALQLLDLFSLNSIGSVLQAYSDLFAEFDQYSWALVQTLNKFSPWIAIAGLIPRFLVAASLWRIYGSCASRKPTVKTSGLTTIFVINLVQLVFSCLFLLGLLVLVGAIYFSAGNLFGADAEMMEIVCLIIGLVTLAIFIFVLVYYCKIATSISNFRSTLQTGVPNKKVSRFVAILCYISGGSMILSGVDSLFSAGMSALGSLYEESVYSLTPILFQSGISNLLNAAALILFGVSIFSYRSKMKALEAEERILSFQTLSYAEPYTAPVYIPPEPAAEEIDETKRWDL